MAIRLMDSESFGTDYVKVGAVNLSASDLERRLGIQFQKHQHDDYDPNILLAAVAVDGGEAVVLRSFPTANPNRTSICVQENMGRQEAETLVALS